MDTPSTSPYISKRLQLLVSSTPQLNVIPFLSPRSSELNSYEKIPLESKDPLLLIDPKLGAHLYIKLCNFHKKTPNEDFYLSEYWQQDNQNTFDVLYCGKNNLTPRIFVINKKIVLGQGSQGTVYRAQEIFKDKNIRDNLLAAIKISKVNTSQKNYDFNNEMKLLAIQNRFRGSYYDNEQMTGYIVQDYCHGKSFFDWCYRKLGFNETTQQTTYKRVKMSNLLKKRFITSILQAYNDLHQKYGILHRDIKPENIMIELTDTDEIIVKIIDFATACLMQNSDKNFSGTPGYLPPESTFDSQNRPYANVQTEYWSIGVICAALLSEKNYLNYLNTKMASAQRKTGFIPDSTQRDLCKALPDVFNKKEPNVRLLRRNHHSGSSSSSYSSPLPTLRWEDYLNQSLCWLAHPNVNLRPCYEDITRILNNLQFYEKNGFLLDHDTESILNEKISHMTIDPLIEIKENKELRPIIEIEDAGSSASNEGCNHDKRTKKNYRATK